MVLWEFGNLELGGNMGKEVLRIGGIFLIVLMRTLVRVLLVNLLCALIFLLFCLRGTLFLVFLSGSCFLLAVALGFLLYGRRILN